MESVTVLEVLEYYDNLEPNVLAISSLYAIAREPNKQNIMIQKLKDHNVSGLLLFNVGKVIQQVSDEVINLCNLIGFPLIIMPIGISYFETLFAIIDCLLKQQNKRLKEYVANYDSLINEVIRSPNHENLLSVYQRILNKHVLFYKVNGSYLLASGAKQTSIDLDGVVEQVKEYQQKLVHTQLKQTVMRKIGNQPILISPVVQKDTIFGFLVILECEKLNSNDEVILRQVKNLICITEINNMKIDEYGRKVRQAFIEELLLGSSKTEEQLINEGRALDIDVDKIQLVICIDIYFKKNWRSVGKLITSNSEDVVMKDLVHQIGVYFPSSYIEIFENKVVVLFRSKQNIEQSIASLENISNNMRASLQKELNADITMGVSNVVKSADGLAEAYRQSYQAVLCYKRLYNKCGFCHYIQIDLIEQVFHVLDPQMVKDRYDSFFKPLIQYDKENNGCLLESFFTLLECDLNASEASRRMFVHRNTMLQRKKKITSLFPYNIFSEENLKIARFICMITNLFEHDK